MENSILARIKVKHHLVHRSHQKSRMILQIRVPPSVLAPIQIILTKILMILIRVGLPPPPPPPPQVSVLNFEMFVLVCCNKIIDELMLNMVYFCSLNASGYLSVDEHYILYTSRTINENFSMPISYIMFIDCHCFVILNEFKIISSFLYYQRKAN